MSNQSEFYNLFQQLRFDPAAFSSASILKSIQQSGALDAALPSSAMLAKEFQQFTAVESAARASLAKEFQQFTAVESAVRVSLAKEFQQFTAVESAVRVSLAKEFQQFTAVESAARASLATLVDSMSLPKKINQSMLSNALLAKQVSDTSLAQIIKQFQKSELFTKRLDLASRLIDPLAVYAKFAEATVERIEQSKSEKTTKALEVSLHLAEVQILATTNAISAIATVPEDNEAVSPSRSLLLPNVQQDELLVAVETGDGNEAALIHRLLTAKVAEIAKLVLERVVQCNEVTKAAGKPEMFKPTTKLLEAFKDFVWLLPQDKGTFAEFVDCLYFIFYEGAGKDKLRFLDSEGGVLQTAECEFIWCIKHLRNKWLRHDVDHGKEAEIRKSWRDLSDKLNWLGLEHPPVTEKHFRDLHSRLLEQAYAFLSRVLEKLIGS